MHRQDAIYLDQLCPKISNKSWRDSLHKLTKSKFKFLMGKYLFKKSMTRKILSCILQS